MYNNKRWVDPRLLPLGTHFKCYGRGFVFVVYETTILYTSWKVRTDLLQNVNVFIFFTNYNILTFFCVLD